MSAYAEFDQEYGLEPENMSMQSSSGASLNTDSDHYHLIISSERRNIIQVEQFIQSIPECTRLDQSVYYNMLIAVTEAANNAIVHGNKLDPAKSVYIGVKSHPSGAVYITIRDQGRGFNPEQVADPREPENLLRDGGRGVFLMKSLATSVHYHFTAHGTEVHMQFG